MDNKGTYFHISVKSYDDHLEQHGINMVFCSYSEQLDLMALRRGHIRYLKVSSLKTADQTTNSASQSNLNSEAADLN